MKTLICTLVILAGWFMVGCSAGVAPTDFGPDPMADGGVSDAAGYTCPATFDECARMVLCTIICHYDDAGALVDGGVDASDPDAGSMADAGADADPPPPVDAGADTGPVVCGSLADGCMGQFHFPAFAFDDPADVFDTAAGSASFGSAGDYIESSPHVLPAVLVARHLDLTDVAFRVGGGGSSCGPLPEFIVSVNGTEVGRFTPAYGENSEHFDFPDVAGTVFTVRLTESTSWCASNLRIMAGTASGEALAILGAP